MVLEDRGGMTFPISRPTSPSISKAVRKRPEIASITLLFAAVPQLYINVDRDRSSKQGVDLAEVYKTLQNLYGRLFVNYFNRFGRQWQVYVEAEANTDASRNLGLFYCANHEVNPFPCLP